GEGIHVIHRIDEIAPDIHHEDSVLRRAALRIHHEGPQRRLALDRAHPGVVGPGGGTIEIGPGGAGLEAYANRVAGPQEERVAPDARMPDEAAEGDSRIGE